MYKRKQRVTYQEPKGGTDENEMSMTPGARILDTHVKLIKAFVKDATLENELLIYFIRLGLSRHLEEPVKQLWQRFPLWDVSAATSAFHLQFPSHLSATSPDWFGLQRGALFGMKGAREEPHILAKYYVHVLLNSETDLKFTQIALLLKVLFDYLASRTLDSGRLRATEEYIAAKVNAYFGRTAVQMVCFNDEAILQSLKQSDKFLMDDLQGVDYTCGRCTKLDLVNDVVIIYQTKNSASMECMEHSADQHSKVKYIFPTIKTSSTG